MGWVGAGWVGFYFWAPVLSKKTAGFEAIFGNNCVQVVSVVVVVVDDHS